MLCLLLDDQWSLKILTKTLPNDLLPFHSLPHFGIISRPDFVLLLHSSNFLCFLNFGVLLIIICCTLGKGDGALTGQD